MANVFLSFLLLPNFTFRGPGNIIRYCSIDRYTITGTVPYALVQLPTETALHLPFGEDGWDKKNSLKTLKGLQGIFILTGK